jgi:hypothetical protein
VSLFYDSTRPALIPADAAGVMPYADGDFAWSQADLERFAHAEKRSITLTGDPAADMIDVEHGAASFATAREYIQERSAAGNVPVVYVDRANLPPLRSRCHGLAYFIVVSTLDGSLYRARGVIGCQFDGGPSADYDQTLIYARQGWPLTFGGPV